MRDGKNSFMKQWMLGLTACLMVCQPICSQVVQKQDSIQEVVVTGTGTSHLLKDAPVQTEVISRQMLRQYGGSSLEDILSGLAASFAFNEGDMGSQLQMNGLGNSYILILVDGKRLHGENGGENDLGVIDPHLIERIEIVKGAASALYGSDAIAGVINIITRKHNDALSLESTTRYDLYNGLQLHDGIGFKTGRLKSYTNFHMKQSDGWQNTSTEDPHQTEFLITDSKNKTVNRHANWRLAQRLTYEVADGLELYAEGDIYWKRIYRPSGSHPGVDIKTYDLRYNDAAAAVGGKWALRGGHYLTLDADWNRHAYTYDFTAVTLTDGNHNGRPTSYFPYYPGQSQLQSDQQRTMAHLKGVFLLPYGNRLSTGLEWRYDWLKAPHRVAGGNATDNTEAFYVQDEFSLIPWLNITGGLRLNHNEQFGWQLTPKLSAMVKVGDLRIRSSWAQGFKSPTPKELHYRYVRDMNGTYLYLGNTALKPQTSNYFSLGAEYTRGGFTLTATVYHNQVDDMIALVTLPNGKVPGDLYAQYQPLKTRQYQNLEQAKTKGVDVSLRYSIKGEWTFGAAYSYLDTDAKVYDTEHDVLRDVVIDGMPHHKASCHATWSHRFTDKYQLGIGIYGRCSSKRYYQLNGNGKGYQLWKLSTSHDISYDKTSLMRIEAGIDNIFGYVDRTPHGLHLGTTTPGRTIYASLAIRLNKGKKLTNQIKSNFNQNNYEQD